MTVSTFTGVPQSSVSLAPGAAAIGAAAVDDACGLLVPGPEGSVSALVTATEHGDATGVALIDGGRVPAISAPPD